MEIKKSEIVKKTNNNKESKNIFINLSKLMAFYEHFELVLKDNKDLLTKYLQDDQVKNKFNETYKKVKADISTLNKIQNKTKSYDVQYEKKEFNYRLNNEKFFLKNDNILTEINKNFKMLYNSLQFKKEIDELKKNLDWYKSSDLFEPKNTMFSQISFY